MLLSALNAANLGDRLSLCQRRLPDDYFKQKSGTSVVDLCTSSVRLKNADTEFAKSSLLPFHSSLRVRNTTTIHGAATPNVPTA
jgi:hypothetical protein